MDVREFTETLQKDPNGAHEVAARIMEQVEAQPKKMIFGQDGVITQLTNAMFTPVAYTAPDGSKVLGQAHVIIEGPPGVGKTDIAKGLSQAVEGKFSRVDGHPELLPRDLIGGEIYNPVLGRHFLVKGPLFAHTVLMDEINRTPPQTQAPLLGAMEERQITLNRTDMTGGAVYSEPYPLYPISDRPEDARKLAFWLTATMNPLEKGGSGVYPLGEAQLDRFAISVSMGYPPREEEKKIRDTNVLSRKIDRVTDLGTLLAIRDLIFQRMKLAEDANEYIQRLIENSRPKRTDPSGTRDGASKELFDFIQTYVQYGISPRTDYVFHAVARTHAFRRGSDIIAIEDVKAVAPMVMHHRLVLTREATAESSDFVDRVVEKILAGTAPYSL